MKLVKVIYDNRTFIDKHGVERKTTMFYLDMDNEKRIAINPCFKEGYILLDAYAVVEHNDSVKDEKKA